MNTNIKSNSSFLSPVLVGISMLFVVYNTLYEHSPMRMVMCTFLSVIAVLFSESSLSQNQKLKLRKTVQIIVALWMWCVLIAFLQGAEKPTRLGELELIIYTGMITFLVSYTKMRVLPLKIALYLILAFYY